MRWNPHAQTQAPSVEEYSKLREQLLIPIQEPGSTDLRIDFYTANEEELNPNEDYERMLKDNKDDLDFAPWDEETIEFQFNKTQNYEPTVTTLPDFSISVVIGQIADWLTNQIFDGKHEVDQYELYDFISNDWDDTVAGGDLSGISITTLVDEINGGAYLGKEPWGLILDTIVGGTNSYLNALLTMALPPEMIPEGKPNRIAVRWPNLVNTGSEMITVINRNSLRTPRIVMTYEYPQDFVSDINDTVIEVFAQKGYFPETIPIDITLVHE
jgi:F0F1-type ATP synthase assembly protein I